ncbi:hypothetical protein NB724_000253 [Pantoea ananatis]|uniref:hypothetical protein n=1 Tax=Pantoea ananas TaxID=553 RepID=UPI000B7E4F48|nr:hypothetical protein [Pantoea ananatis]AWQ20128.1 hypothetical protein C1N63_15505 [Pantoea ananatis]MCW0315102.1 hypothetical protein [Pantoea ananatis]MCW0333329.1 hypothetical protein [Pantoea ananatis]MCW0381421.1 hypothetical protein [Pantoea ananatis]MCW0406086.1 hypothetical protein [Pantoea ananatis]
MKIAIFIIVLLATFVLIPDSWFNTLFMSPITIEGDGVEAMNSYSFTFIVLKFVLSLVLAVLASWGYRKLKR